MKKVPIIIGILAAAGIFAAIVWEQRRSNVTTPAPVLSDAGPAGENAPAPQEAPRAELPFDINTYTSTTTGFSISYPSIYKLKESGKQTPDFGTLAPIIMISSPEVERQGTNLVASSVIVGSVTEKAALDTCTKPQPGESRLGSIEISQAPFSIFIYDGTAAGNFYQTVRYRAVRSGVCYEVTLLMHSGNIGNYPEGSVKEFDRPVTLERLKAILYSFKFN